VFLLVGRLSHFIGVLLLEGVEMKQLNFWEGQPIVKDPQQIKAYLARLMRILKGEEL